MKHEFTLFVFMFVVVFLSLVSIFILVREQHNHTIGFNNTILSKSILAVLDYPRQFMLNVNGNGNMISETTQTFVFNQLTPIHVLPNISTTTEIPLNIFQTWVSRDFPPKMQDCIYSISQDNREFKHYVYNDADCREFIKNNFDQDVLLAYDSLVPGAYKADLWRYCILFKYGGIYMDVKFHCVDDFKLITLCDDEYFVNDRYSYSFRHGIYNAFIVAKPGNSILEKCINKVVENVNNKYYGETSLDITGPTMMYPLFSPLERGKLNRLHLDNNNVQINITGNIPILASYPEYRYEQSKYSPIEHYGVLYSNHKVYM